MTNFNKGIQLLDDFDDEDLDNGIKVNFGASKEQKEDPLPKQKSKVLGDDEEDDD